MNVTLRQLSYFVALAEERHADAVEADGVEFGKDLVPVLLQLTDVPGRNADQEHVEGLQPLQIEAADVQALVDVLVELVADHLRDVLGVAGGAAVDEADVHP